MDGRYAETLYRSLDYVVVGVIPRYARGSTTPALEPATFMYKELEDGTLVPRLSAWALGGAWARCFVLNKLHEAPGTAQSTQHQSP